jgi:prepilin-type N-terminal cleavage/methylation domain-containing protein
MRKQNKKGFTIVELVIVIAVIAILVAVMVPTFVTLVRKAQISNDRQLVKNLNTALQTESQSKEAPKTMQAALDIAAEYGYDVAKINAKASDNEILWDSTNNVYCYFDKDGGIEYIPEAPKAKETADVDYWVVSETVNTKYSTYYTGSADAEIVATKGFDAGNSGVKNVTYKTNDTQKVTIRTYGSDCVLTIEAPNSDVNFYGFAKEVNVKEVKDSSLHIYGSTKQLAVTKGHVAVEETGIVFEVVQMGAADVAEVASVAATITNNGYIGVISLSKNTVEAVKTAIKDDTTKVVATKAIGGDYEIATLAQLENFRDTVNAGNDFAGKTVKLTADIKLNDGWKPIGEGSRAVGKGSIAAQNTTTFFKGEFNGQDHTISNLNNKGFVPTAARLVDDDGVKTYAYGLFALVGAGAEIKNLKLTNVAIDTTTYGEAIGDSVGALIGYSHGSLTVSGIEVSGSIKSGDAVGGIIGRSYNKAGEAQADFAYSVTGCVNNAAVTAGTEVAQKAAGIVGYININKGYAGTFTGNTNNGTISGGAAYSGTSAKTYVAGGVGTYVLNAKLAVVSSAVNTLNYGTATKTTSASSTYTLD